MSFLLFSSVPSLSSYHKSTSLYQYSLIILSQSAQEAKHFVFLRKIFVLVTKTRKILCVFSLFFRVSFRARDVAERPVDVRFATTEAERRLQNILWTFALQRPERSGDLEPSSPGGARKHKKDGIRLDTIFFVFLLERETGLEPAASTLARSRSTN